MVAATAAMYIRQRKEAQVPSNQLTAKVLQNGFFQGAEKAFREAEMGFSGHRKRPFDRRHETPPGSRLHFLTFCY